MVNASQRLGVSHLAMYLAASLLALQTLVFVRDAAEQDSVLAIVAAAVPVGIAALLAITKVCLWLRPPERIYRIEAGQFPEPVDPEMVQQAMGLRTTPSTHPTFYIGRPSTWIVTGLTTLALVLLVASSATSIGSFFAYNEFLPPAALLVALSLTLLAVFLLAIAWLVPGFSGRPVAAGEAVSPRELLALLTEIESEAAKAADDPAAVVSS